MISLPKNTKTSFEAWYVESNHDKLIPLNVVYKAPIVYTMGIYIKYLRLQGLHLQVRGMQLAIEKDTQFIIPDSEIYFTKEINDNGWENLISYGFILLSKWVDAGEVPF